MKYYDESKVYLEKRQMSDANEHEKLLFELSGLKDVAPLEIWTAIGTNQQLAYCTHGIFRYFGKFPPPIATQLINEYTDRTSVVYDPMSGSGTTGVEALLNGRKCILNDVSPLSVLLARVKTTYINEKALNSAADQIVDNYKPLSLDEYSFSLDSLRNHEHWFLPETEDSLRGLKYLIEKIEDEKIRNFFLVCFAATVRRVSKATTQQGRLFLDVETAEKDALPFFKKKVETAIKGVSCLPKNGQIKIISDDVRAIRLGDDELADLVICHPPYFNSYKYSSINSLELSWLGEEYSKLRKKEVREFFKVGKEENAKYYVEDMTLTLATIADSMKQGAVMGLMIGDTMIHGNYIQVTKQLLNSVSSLFDVELVALRAPKYTEAAWVASQRRKSGKVGITLYDFIIILRKK